MKKSRKTTRKRATIDLQALGHRIRELRGFYVSQADFARQIGVTQSHLSALERGIKEPGAAVLLTISREFGKSVDWLLTGEEKPTKK
jgi:transcriptional regulator with XRE-family HTH domain